MLADVGPHLHPHAEEAGGLSPALLLLIVLSLVAIALLMALLKRA